MVNSKKENRFEVKNRIALFRNYSKTKFQKVKLKTINLGKQSGVIFQKYKIKFKNLNLSQTIEEGGKLVRLSGVVFGVVVIRSAQTTVLLFISLAIYASIFVGLGLFFTYFFIFFYKLDEVCDMRDLYIWLMNCFNNMMNEEEALFFSVTEASSWFYWLIGTLSVILTLPILFVLAEKYCLRLPKSDKELRRIHSKNVVQLIRSGALKKLSISLKLVGGKVLKIAVRSFQIAFILALIASAFRQPLEYGSWNRNLNLERVPPAFYRPLNSTIDVESKICDETEINLSSKHLKYDFQIKNLGKIEGVVKTLDPLSSNINQKLWKNKKLPDKLMNFEKLNQKYGIPIQDEHQETFELYLPLLKKTEKIKLTIDEN